MEEILVRLNMVHYLQAFTAENIQPSDVKYLTEAEWGQLGVRSLGDRIRIRQACDVSSTLSAVTSHCLMLQRERRGSRAQIKRED